jgi:predicted AAA+ superfamily ATPase
LLGPRGTGKTTWLTQHFAPALRIDLLEEARYQRYLADPAAFERDLGAAGAASWVVVDEVQRLPSLLNEVHRQVEARKLKFALTGSSARKLKRADVNLLGGRAVRRTMFPLSPVELGGDFVLERVLSSGSLPLVWAASDPDDTLEAYVHTYMKEEIQAEALVRNLPGFARFLPVAALFHGQVLNAASLAREAGVARTTVIEYLSILEDTLLAARLDAYEGRLRVREKKHPKLYWIDPGLVRTLKGARGPAAADEQGPLFEGFVWMLLRLYADLRKLPPHDIFYWSPAEARNTEVDFLLVAGKTKVALEVKATKRVRSEHFTGLRAVNELPGLKRRVLVATAGEVGKTPDGIEIMSLEKLVEELEQGTLIA